MRLLVVTVGRGAGAVGVLYVFDKLLRKAAGLLLLLGVATRAGVVAVGTGVVRRLLTVLVAVAAVPRRLPA